MLAVGGLGAAPRQEVSVSPGAPFEMGLGWGCRRAPLQLGDITSSSPCGLSSWRAGDLGCPVLPGQQGPLAAQMVSLCYGNCTWPPWQSGYPWLRVISRYELGFWRRINLFLRKKTLTTKFCMKGRCQRSHAEPRIKQSQALSSSLILHPFNWISSTHAGERGGTIPAISEGQGIGDSHISREEKGTAKQQFWWFFISCWSSFYSFCS